MQKELTVYITTCDSNQFVLKYFQYFFNKYWGKHMKVKILGFNKPNIEFDDNFEFVSLGTEQINGSSGWSNYLIDYFNTIDDEYFIFGIDDFMVARPVDEEVFNTCKELLSNDVGRIDLQPLQYARDPRLFYPYTEVNGIKFFKMLQKDPNGGDIYRTAGAFSIWNKKWFLKNLKPDWSPWDWEIKGSRLSENDGFEVIGSYDRFAIKKSELLSNQYPGFINILGIRDKDINHMKTMVSPEDRVKEFNVIGPDRFGYSDYAGKDWINKIFGE
jgi:hypothetical protein